MSDYNKTKLAVIAGALLLGPILLYAYWGSSQEFSHVSAFKAISIKVDHLSSQKDLTLEDVLKGLESLSVEVKDSHKGLARIGAIYSELGRYEEACVVLEKAMELSPSTGDYALQWIYHQSFLHQGKLPPEARAKAKALLNSPETKPAAMNMLAMDDYFQGNYQAAIDYWTDLLQNDSTLTAERRQILEKAMANAKAKMAGSLAASTK